jgi:glutamate racemase
MIGVFDSGVGGLTVVKEIKKWLPNCPVVYFGDTARCPWGNKSPDLVKKYADEITTFLIGQGIKDIVIACNTASALTVDYLRDKYSAINFYDVIEPVINKVRKEVNAEGRKKIFSVGIIGTKGTIEDGMHERKLGELSSNIKIYAKACPLFVPLVEERMINHQVTKTIAEEYLKDFKEKKLNALILGCTHYPIIKDLIQEELKDVKLIDSAEEAAKKIVRQRYFSDMRGKSDVFYFSDLSIDLKKSVEDILGRKVVIRKMIF